MVNKLTDAMDQTILAAGKLAQKLRDVAPTNEPMAIGNNIDSTQTMKQIANKPATKKGLKRFLPDAQQIKNNKNLRIFGKFLHNPNLWHFNRSSVAKAFSIGLFVCYIPALGHMALATVLSIVFRANLPISVALVWLANPVTMPPMYYFGYKIGALILGTPANSFHFEMTLQWLLHELGPKILPLFLGCFICGTVIAILGNLGVRLYWRYSVSRAMKQRAQRQK